MATITSASSGNFSDTATWVGGVVPGVGDDAVAATTHVVTIDTDVTVISFQQAGTGKFVLGNGRTVTGNVIANAGTFTSGGTVEVTATTTAVINGNVTGVSTTANNTAGIVITGTGTLTINGSVTGSAGNGASEALGSSAVYTNVTCTITINGAVAGGSGTHKRGFHINSNASFSITGNLTGGNAGSHALFITGNNSAGTVIGNATNGGGVNDAGKSIQISGNSSVSLTGNAVSTTSNNGNNIILSGASASLTVTGLVSAGGVAGGVVVSGGTASLTVIGDVTGSPVSSPQGVLVSGINATCYVTGNVSGGAIGFSPGIVANGGASTVTVIGSATAKPNLGHAINSSATSNGVVFQGNITDHASGVVAIYTRIFRMSATNSGVTRYANTIGYPNGTLVSRVSPDNVTGMAATSNVRAGTIYGYNNELTGTLAMPPAQSVAYGVPVDATTGTAELDLGRVAEIIGLQVAAGATEGTAI